jgi:2-methylcitrate dehydratase
MDSTTARLVDFALGMEFSSLPSETVHECKRRLIDTFACAIGAYDEPLSCMARAVARRQTGNPSASVWGCSWTTTPEAAAFANGVMLRLDDISDNYRVKSGGHPSDVIAGILAVGEAVHADGRSVINAITLAYDVYCSFCESYDFNSKGWDQPVYGVVACVLGAGRLLALSREQMGHAVALALAPNLALFQTRCGNLSSWKGCAGANASRNAVFAAFLAKDGFTGPHEVFEGKCGLWDVAGKFVWNPEIAFSVKSCRRTIRISPWRPIELR